MFNKLLKCLFISLLKLALLGALTKKTGKLFNKVIVHYILHTVGYGFSWSCS